MRKILSFLFLSLLVGLKIVVAQNALKNEKQQTNFYYVQLNLHAGVMNGLNGSRWDLANRSPNNQIAFQYFAKRKKTLQKGYVKNISLSASKFRFSIPFIKSINDLGEKEAEVRFQLLDTWLKFNTKWDRTHFWIGNKSIPYGHNPKLDPVSDFMTNLTKMDYGFVQDIGVFFKSPISSNLDVESSLTMGGWLAKPVLVCENILNNSEQSQTSDLKFSFANFEYKNTWLFSTRIGSPTFKKNEFGIILSKGKINNVLVENDLLKLNRIGGDWVYKIKEKVKFSNQIVVGYNVSDIQKQSTSVHTQNAVDFILNDHFFISTSFAYNYYDFSKSGADQNTYINANSITYSFSTHTRLRLNHYFSSVSRSNEKQWGVFLQFVTGFGKRP